MTRIVLLLVIGAGMATAPSTSAAEQLDVNLEKFEFREIHMGVEFKVLFYAAHENAANRAAKAAFVRIEELNGRLSDYSPNSELSRLSAAAPTSQSVDVSSDLWTVLQQAQLLACRTDGAFDVTVGPLTRLWRRARRRGEMPAADRLSAALESVGYKQIELRHATRRVELLQSNMRLDLGGIAKGYAVDQALVVLRRHGIFHALVDGSGDIAFGDPPPGESGWRIGIAPLNAGEPPSRFLSLVNQAVASSGDAWQHVEIDGVRYSHIVDPKTGIGLTTPSSVTVVAPDCMTADSLASAVSVLGPEVGTKLIERTDGAESLTIAETDGNKVQVKMSKGFPNLPTSANKSNR